MNSTLLVATDFMSPVHSSRERMLATTMSAYNLVQPMASNLASDDFGVGHA